MRLFIESGLEIFRLFIRVNRLREIMAALGSGNRFVNARKAPYFEIHSCLYEIDGFFILNNKKYLVIIYITNIYLLILRFFQIFVLINLHVFDYCVFLNIFFFPSF